MALEQVSYTSGAGICTGTEGQLELTLSSAMGTYEPTPRELAFGLVVGRRPACVTRDGATVAWEWDETACIALIAWPDDHAGATIELIGA